MQFETGNTSRQASERNREIEKSVYLLIDLQSLFAYRLTILAVISNSNIRLCGITRPDILNQTRWLLEEYFTKATLLNPYPSKLSMRVREIPDSYNLLKHDLDLNRYTAELIKL